MGFNSVYKSLQELFPQIDGRVLRAVAIEHSKDADAAVEAVLLEVIPFFTERSRPNSSLTGSIAVGESSSAVMQNGDNENGGSQQSLCDADGGQNEPCYDTYDGHRVGESNVNVAESTLTEQGQENSIKMSADVYSHGEPVVLVDQIGENTLQIEVSGSPERGETSSADKCLESCIETSSDNFTGYTLETLKNADMIVYERKNLDEESEYFDDCLENDFGQGTNPENQQAKFSADDNNYANGSASLTIHDHTLSTSGSQFITLADMHGTNLENMEVSLSSDTAPKMDSPVNIVCTEDESSNATLSKSSEIHITVVLEEIIADARNNKKTLFSAMESVIGLMREVEDKEQAAEQAKKESAMGGIDIEDKIAYLEKMLPHAKAANDMHAGEVHGEKAILATELRELQSRVFSLSDERDKSLAVLDEMCQTLELRLTAAENEIKSAEKEKLEKEKTARKALADQELIMEKVLQESNILKQQAEENAKLQEFLVDRGRVVDVLQGEIAVICQDVRLLKEKFDEHIPFSKSVASCQTSCILASSGSSLRSSIADLVEPIPDQADSSETKEKDLIDSADEDAFANEVVPISDRKTLIDDGWDLFEDELSKCKRLA